MAGDGIEIGIALFPRADLLDFFFLWFCLPPILNWIVLPQLGVVFNPIESAQFIVVPICVLIPAHGGARCAS